MSKKPALGRGIGEAGAGYITVFGGNVDLQGSSSLGEIPLSKIKANPDQPRRIFDEEALQELIHSIKQVGVLTPITVRKLDDGNYQIVAGERRYRAARFAGLEKIPAYVKDVKDKDVNTQALIENVVRQDLNAIEVAMAYQNILNQNDYTQEELSEKIGKNRATIANYIRLLKLPAEIQGGLRDRKIEMAHAKTLVSIDDPLTQLEIYELIIDEGLSVRKVEEYASALKKGESLSNILKGKETEGKETVKKINKSVKKTTPEDFEFLERELSRFLHAKVQLSCNDKGKGKISILFNSDNELEKIMSIFDALKNK
jgi:ParB family chromosome partitioning protein